MLLINHVQIEIVLGKTENFDELMAAAAAEDGENRDVEEQSAWSSSKIYSRICWRYVPFSDLHFCCREVEDMSL